MGLSEGNVVVDGSPVGSLLGIPDDGSAEGGSEDGKELGNREGDRLGPRDGFEVDTAAISSAQV